MSFAALSLIARDHTRQLVTPVCGADRQAATVSAFSGPPAARPMGNLQSLDNRQAGLSKAELERMERRWVSQRRAAAQAPPLMPALQERPFRCASMNERAASLLW